MLNPILYAVPLYLAMMAVEYTVERRRGRPVYRAADNLASLSLGILMLAYDFCCWRHRMGLEVPPLWAAHGVHHGSEDHELSSALRQTGTGFLFGWVFCLPMALVGAALLAVSPLHGLPAWLLWAAGLADAWALTRAGRATPSRRPSAA